jgi:hypothetical protein
MMPIVKEFLNSKHTFFIDFINKQEMNKKIKSWEDVYKLPLKLDEYGNQYVWCDNDVMAITFDSLTDNERDECVKAINGKSNFKINNLSYKDSDFYQNSEYIFCVRGWGHLTGIGGLNLSAKKALKIQDGFVNYIFEKLKG